MINNARNIAWNKNSQDEMDKLTNEIQNLEEKIGKIKVDFNQTIQKRTDLQKSYNDLNTNIHQNENCALDAINDKNEALTIEITKKIARAIEEKFHLDKEIQKIAQKMIILKEERSHNSHLLQEYKNSFKMIEVKHKIATISQIHPPVEVKKIIKSIEKSAADQKHNKDQERIAIQEESSCDSPFIIKYNSYMGKQDKLEEFILQDIQKNKHTQNNI